MSFFAILFALLIEQVRPLATRNPVHAGLRLWTRWVARNLDAGRHPHGWIVWSVSVVVPALLAAAIHWLLMGFIGWLLAMAWSVAVLYFTLGFRQFSHHFTDIRDALDEGNEQKARELLAQWQQVQVGDIPRSEIVRHVIEFSVIAAHRHVFGVFFWYAVMSVIGLGPVGAGVYRLAEYVQRRWQREQGTDSGVSPVLAQVAEQAWRLLDWLPARATALGFAIVGSFEDAMDGWRNHAQKFPQDNDGVILAATAGAINVQLGGGALPQTDAQDGLDSTMAEDSSASTPGHPAELAHLASVVGLVWRTVVLWMVLLALLTLARLLG